MKRRTRSPHTQAPPQLRHSPYLKFLKPGALAQLRDSRIIARSHRSLSSSLSPPSSPPPPQQEPPVNLAAGGSFPCFAARMYGPRCPQRKKLVAAKAVLFMRPPASPGSDPLDPIISVLNNSDNSVVIAH